MSKKEVMPAKQLGGVFPNEETFQRIYEECLENEPAAPEAVVVATVKCMVCLRSI